MGQASAIFSRLQRALSAAPGREKVARMYRFHVLEVQASHVSVAFCPADLATSSTFLLLRRLLGCLEGHGMRFLSLTESCGFTSSFTICLTPFKGSI
jgi:hypothetical protein